MENGEKKRRGRHRSADPLCHDCKVRFTAEQLQRLDECARRLGVTRAQAIRAAVLRMLDAESGE